MKHFFLIAVILLCLPFNAPTANATDLIVERGPHHRVWQRTRSDVLPDGNSVNRVSSYTELATGLHYWSENRWNDSVAEIEIINGSAVARRGQHNVIFSANLNSPGAIDMQSPDGKRFRSHLLGIAYTDYANGRSVMLAEVKDCLGAVRIPNQVLYAGAIDGDCSADVIYTYSLGTFEQDVVIVRSPPGPDAYGLNPETTRMEVFTEFIELPPGVATAVVLKQEPDPVARREMVEPDLVDHRLDFGAMKFETGHAFPSDQADRLDEGNVMTGKSMELIDGRVILIEKVDYVSIEPHLRKLPQNAAAKPIRRPGAAGEKMWAKALPARPKGAPGQWKERQYASVDAKRRGFVIDYIAVNGTLTNYAFRAGSTTFVTNLVSLYGTTRFEGTAVIKCNNLSGTQIDIYGAVDCQTGPFRPLIITAKDDNTVGETITGSSGSPSGYYGGELYLKSTSAPYELHDIHATYSYRLFTLSANVVANVSHVQAGYGVMVFGQLGSSLVTCRNFLFYNQQSYAILIQTTGTNRLEQGTVHRSPKLRSSTNGLVTLTNCLLISVTNNLIYDGINNITNLDDTGIFQTVGAATHYLASGSTNRDAGTTNINPTLLAALRKQTTYPPIVIGSGNLYSNSLVLTPQAQRDTDTPDLGYHYNPLDFVLNSVYLTNASIVATQGVALGVRTLTPIGLGVYDGASFDSIGTPNNLNRLVRYNVVQEKGSTNWADNAAATVYNLYSTTAGAGPSVKVRFTEFSAPAGIETYHYYGTANDSGSHNFRDCQFHGGYFWSERPTLGVTNCLFNRTQFGLVENTDMSPSVRNSTFVGSDLTLGHVGSGSWTFIDNLFDSTTTSTILGSFTNRFNAYTTNAARLTPTNISDRVLSVTNIAYDLGFLGAFYLPTNLTSHSPLFNNGSTNASLLTLYHYTTTTNQISETNSLVDIGFHYIATDGNGIPKDFDGDGIPDYLEDANGNGNTTPDSGETKWQDSADQGFKIWITRPRKGDSAP